MTATDPSFTLEVTRQFGKGDVDQFLICGDGPFMVQEFDALLGDPGLVALKLRRDTKYERPDSQYPQDRSS